MFGAIAIFISSILSVVAMAVAFTPMGTPFALTSFSPYPASVDLRRYLNEGSAIIEIPNQAWKLIEPLRAEDFHPCERHELEAQRSEILRSVARHLPQSYGIAIASLRSGNPTNVEYVDSFWQFSDNLGRLETVDIYDQYRFVADNGAESCVVTVSRVYERVVSIQ